MLAGEGIGTSCVGCPEKRVMTGVRGEGKLRLLAWEYSRVGGVHTLQVG